MGGIGGESDTQKALEAEAAKQEAIKKQQQKDLQEKAVQTLKRKQASFAGNVPTSLFTGGNDNTKLG